jgi:hypothetical protein
VSHVEQSTGCIALDSHVFGLGQSSQGTKRARPGDLCFVIFVGGQIGDAADSIALDFDVAGHHLSDQRWEAAQLYDGNFVLGWDMLAMIY